jgi:uncharacterized membrane protein (DUF373 family)
MRKAINKITNYFSSNFEVLVATMIFLVILIAGHDFYKAIILMLEFIVIMEVVKMISDFIRKETLRLRFVIDIFIIFLIREVVILSANKNRDYVDIVFLLFVIFIFFIFRILSLKYSPNDVKQKEVVHKIEE